MKKMHLLLVLLCAIWQLASAQQKDIFGHWGITVPVQNEVPRLECRGELHGGTVEFTSPGYPRMDNRSRICTLTVVPPLNSCGLRVFIENGMFPESYGSCGHGSIQVSGEGVENLGGFPLCGDLTGYELSSSFREASNIGEVTVQVEYHPRFKFKLVVSLVSCNAFDTVEAPSACGLTSPITTSNVNMKVRKTSKKKKKKKQTKERQKNKKKTREDFMRGFKNPSSIFHKAYYAKLAEMNRTVPNEDFKIVGGDDTGLGEFPWQVGLDMNNVRFCGGGLISDRWVITAAHCMYAVAKEGSKLFEVTVALGDINQFTDTEGITRKIEKVVLHSSYDDLSANSDIALVKLSQPVIFSDTISPICLPLPHNDFNLAEEDLLISGWGFKEYDYDYSDTYSDYYYYYGYEDAEILQQLKLSYVNVDKCRKDWDFIESILPDQPVITDGMLCATAGNDKGICFGDSGGPLVVKSRRGAYVVVGIASFITDCFGYYAPSVFARTSYFLKWIYVVIS